VAQELRTALVLLAALVASSTALDWVPWAELGKAALEPGASAVERQGLLAAALEGKVAPKVAHPTKALAGQMLAVAPA